MTAVDTAKAPKPKETEPKDDFLPSRLTLNDEAAKHLATGDNPHPLSHGTEAPAVGGTPLATIGRTTITFASSPPKIDASATAGSPPPSKSEASTSSSKAESSPAVISKADTSKNPNAKSAPAGDGSGAGPNPDKASDQPAKPGVADTKDSDKPATKPRPDVTIDASTRKEIIDELIKDVSKEYIFSDVATKVAKMLRDNEASGAYDSITSGSEFAKVLTDQLRAVSGDKHFAILVTNADAPKKESADITPAVLARIKAADYGITKAAVLPGDIGYLSMSSFEPADVAAVTKAIDSAMSSLAGTHALIIDMRNNGGGDFHTVLTVLDHLLNPNTHVNDIYWRADGTTDESWTSAPAVSPTFGATKDIYVLTSESTFSAGEELAYDLQALKRATVVGDTTGGGANPGHLERLSSRFFGFIPAGEAINPTTKTNWEGTGVTPDVKVPAASALDVAEKLALDKEIATESNPSRLAELKAREAELEKH